MYWFLELSVKEFDAQTKEFVAQTKESFWSMNGGLTLLSVFCLREETKRKCVNQDEGCLVLARTPPRLTLLLLLLWVVFWLLRPPAPCISVGIYVSRTSSDDIGSSRKS